MFLLELFMLDLQVLQYKKGEMIHEDISGNSIVYLVRGNSTLT